MLKGVNKTIVAGLVCGRLEGGMTASLFSFKRSPTQHNQKTFKPNPSPSFGIYKETELASAA